MQDQHDIEHEDAVDQVAAGEVGEEGERLLVHLAADGAHLQVGDDLVDEDAEHRQVVAQGQTLV